MKLAVWKNKWDWQTLKQPKTKQNKTQQFNEWLKKGYCKDYQRNPEVALKTYISPN